MEWVRYRREEKRGKEWREGREGEGSLRLNRAASCLTPALIPLLLLPLSLVLQNTV